MRHLMAAALFIVPTPLFAAASPGCTAGPVLMVVDGVAADQPRMQAYSNALAASGLYAALGGYYLNSPRPLETFEGVSPAGRATLVVRFPCLANARAFWNSAAYQQAIRPLRLAPSAGDFTVRVFAEADLPAYMAGRVERADYRAAFPAGKVPAAPTGDPVAQATAPMLRRATLVVRSLDHALGFYHDLLGLSPGAASAIESGSSAYTAFGIVAGVPLRFQALSAGTQPDVIGLIEYPGAIATATPQAALVLHIPGRLERVRDALAAAGQAVAAPSDIASPIFGQGRELAVRDPDGHLVMLYDFGAPASRSSN